MMVGSKSWGKGAIGLKRGEWFKIVFVGDLFCFFFFQAEDGIRDDLVTGVQTCALPI